LKVVDLTIYSVSAERTCPFDRSPAATVTPSGPKSMKNATPLDRDAADRGYKSDYKRASAAPTSFAADPFILLALITLVESTTTLHPMQVTDRVQESTGDTRPNLEFNGRCMLLQNGRASRTEPIGIHREVRLPAGDTQGLGTRPNAADGPTRALLAVIARHPEAIEDTLRKAG